MKLTKSESNIVSTVRVASRTYSNVAHGIKRLFKSRITQVVIVVIVLSLITCSSYAWMQSNKFKSEGDALYSTGNYSQALTQYKLASRWWIFDKINSKLDSSTIANKIKKAEIMIHSSEFYDQGKLAYQSGNYTSAKWYLSNMAENDPRNVEAKEMSAKIDEELAKKPTATQNNPVTSTKTTTQSPASPPESYTHDPYYPILLAFSDDRSNTNKASDKNSYSGSQINFRTNTKLKIGDSIRWKVQASDPKGRQLLYRFSSNSTNFNGLRGNGYSFSPNNELTYTISQEDLKAAGGLFRVVVAIKSDKDYYREVSFDDSTFMDYTLLPE